MESRSGTAVDSRQDRLDALTDWDRQRLLAYLDGRAPGLVDEWFEKRPGAAHNASAEAPEWPEFHVLGCMEIDCTGCGPDAAVSRG